MDGKMLLTLVSAIFVYGVSSQEAIKCGQVITDLANGEVETPGFPKPLETNETVMCKWNVTLPTVAGCSNVVRFVYEIDGYDNETKASTKFTIQSGGKPLPVVVKNGTSKSYLASGTQIVIVYTLTVAKAKKPKVTTGYAFKLNFYSSGTMKPNVSKESIGLFLLREDEAALCNATWEIQKPAGDKDVISLQLYENKKLASRSINVDETPKGENVTHVASLASTIDYPINFFMDANTKVSYSLTSPPKIINSSNIVFRGYYVMLPSCSVQLSTTKGVLKSPLYPDRYPENAYCVSNIAVPDKYKVHVVFSSFQLAKGHSLIFAVKNKTIATYDSMSNITSDVIADGPLQVTFSSQEKSIIKNVNVAAGFKVDFQRIGPNCGGAVTGKASGQVTTPGYSNAVPAGTICVWIITIPPPKDKTTANNIKFTYFANSKSNNLEIKDGALNSSQSINFKFTNGKESKPLYSRTNQLWIKYTATSKTQENSFQLKFSSNECNKKSQCGTGICMHPDWHCNGVDDCGDMTDEKNCGFAGWILAVSVVVAIIGTVIAMFVIAYIIKKYRRNDDMTTGLTSHADE